MQKSNKSRIPNTRTVAEETSSHSQSQSCIDDQPTLEERKVQSAIAPVASAVVLEGNAVVLLGVGDRGRTIQIILSRGHEILSVRNKEREIQEQENKQQE